MKKRLKVYRVAVRAGLPVCLPVSLEDKTKVKRFNERRYGYSLPVCLPVSPGEENSKDTREDNEHPYIQGDARVPDLIGSRKTSNDLQKRKGNKNKIKLIVLALRQTAHSRIRNIQTWITSMSATT
jgi:hypothetical protein